MGIKIVNKTGIVNDTKVYLDSGEEIKHINKIEILPMSAYGQNMQVLANITVFVSSLEIEADMKKLFKTTWPEDWAGVVYKDSNKS